MDFVVFVEKDGVFEFVSGFVFVEFGLVMLVQCWVGILFDYEQGVFDVVEFM